MSKLNFNDFLFRASNSYFLTIGNIGITESQEKEIESLIKERDTGINENGNKVKWTDNKKQKLDKLLDAKENPSISKTAETELIKIYREVKYNRRFLFTNKYVQKGLQQEDESFSLYQKYLKEVKGVNAILINNKERLNGKYFTGESDVSKEFYKQFNWGFDVKTVWSLETMPTKEYKSNKFVFEKSKLNPEYECQDLVYMDLIKELQGIELDHFKTSSVLVNSTERTLFNEKMKHLGANDNDEEACKDIYKELEKTHIVDYDRFKHVYPHHDLEITREEWYGNEWDIPLTDRVIEKKVFPNEEKVSLMKERVILYREILNNMV